MPFEVVMFLNTQENLGYPSDAIILTMVDLSWSVNWGQCECLWTFRTNLFYQVFSICVIMILTMIDFIWSGHLSSRVLENKGQAWLPSVVSPCFLILTMNDSIWRYYLRLLFFWTTRTNLVTQFFSMYQWSWQSFDLMWSVTWGCHVLECQRKTLLL